MLGSVETYNSRLRVRSRLSREVTVHFDAVNVTDRMLGEIAADLGRMLAEKHGSDYAVPGSAYVWAVEHAIDRAGFPHIRPTVTASVTVGDNTESSHIYITVYELPAEFETFTLRFG